MLFQTHFKQISNISVDFLDAFHPHSFSHSVVLLRIQCKNSILNYLHFKLVERLLNLIVAVGRYVMSASQTTAPD